MAVNSRLLTNVVCSPIPSRRTTEPFCVKPLPSTVRVKAEGAGGLVSDEFATNVFGLVSVIENG